MKLIYWTEFSQYHASQKEDNSNNYRSICNAPEDIKGNNSMWAYKKGGDTPLPTKDNICKECFKANKEEIVFYLTKLKLGIKV